MKLLTKGIMKLLPPLRATDGRRPEQRLVPVKFFNPTGAGTWYALEFDGVDRFYGLVDLQEKELGYFSLDELSKIVVRFGLKIERDIHWDPKTTLADVLAGRRT